MFAWLKNKLSRKEKRTALDQWEHQAVREYLDYLSNPWRIMWANFLAGLAKGLGLIIGVALVFTVVTYVLSNVLSQIPVVGDFFSAINIWIQQTLTQRGVGS
mgnify:CR=1 FL=1